MAEKTPPGQQHDDPPPHRSDEGDPGTDAPHTTVQRSAEDFPPLSEELSEEEALATRVLDVPSADWPRSSARAHSSDRPSSAGISPASPPSSHRPAVAASDSGNSSGNSSGSASDKALPEYLEQFRILKELGSGAFGIVYMAEDESLQRRVAIKVPKVSDPRQAASYLNEARKAAAIECEGIVPIYHVGVQSNGVPFVVQKLIDGPSMRELLRTHGALPPAHAVTLLRDVARALAIAHHRGIYHRDLKPDNVLVDSRGIPWIADFGLAISEHEQVTQTGQLAGTLAYMSPEQIEGHVDWLDGRTDIWALGIMFYELLSGRPPFEGKTRQSLMQQICHRDPRPLQQRAPNLPAELDRVFLGCCAKRPNDRYASADLLADALTGLIAQGLSSDPIDGSELKSNQTLSQYHSIQRSSQFSTAHASTQRQLETATRVADSEPSAAEPSVAEPKPPNVARANQFSSEAATGPSRAVAADGRSRRLTSVLLLTGIIILGIGAAAVVLNRPRSTDDSSVAMNQQRVDPRATISAGGTGESAGDAAAASNGNADAADLRPQQEIAAVQRTAEDPRATMDPSERPAATAKPAIAADGSAELPWVVASDGTGSHTTIAEAVAASSPGHTIHIQPGSYKETVRIQVPLTLIGLGDRGDAELRHSEQSPLEVACAIGTVRLVGLEIRGDGRRSGAEFNAINLLSGRLRVENCVLRSRIWNAIHLSPGTSLHVEDCEFVDSDQFAIVAKAHAELTVQRCKFFESGLQIIDGSATVTVSEFLGREGIYIGHSGGNPTRVQQCKFIGCGGYGINASEFAQIDVSDGCILQRCQVGVQAFRGGEVAVRGGAFVDCQRAVNVAEGSASLSEDCTITGGLLGATMKGGRLQLTNVKISEPAQYGVTVEQDGTLEIVDSELEGCQECAINMTGGALKMDRSQISQSGYVGIYLSDAFREGELKAVEFRDNAELALTQEAGRLLCEQSRFSGGKGALAVRPPAGQTAEITLRNVSFEQQAPVGAFTAGSVVTLADIEPAEVPLGKLFVFYENVQVMSDRD